MNIGEASKASGVHSKMIRHYEAIGLISKASRTSAGYRVYSAKDTHTLKFIKHSRDLGFSIKEIKKLLGLWKNKTRASSEVKKIALMHVSEIEEKIQALEKIKTTLKTLAKTCHGNDAPDCPILESLSSAT